LYSLAIHPEQRGRGLASQLLDELENTAAELGRLYMRLEVADSNKAAIKLYQNRDYRVFGEYSHYYDDDSDALRMQKTIRRAKETELVRHTPWYQQTTEFTCGPAALMMVMASLDNNLMPSQLLELDLWREATTIFMTSGHGGCHPIGLGIAAAKRGFSACVYVNTTKPLFLDGVRSQAKKAIMTTVHEQFVEKATAQGVEINYTDLSQTQVDDWLNSGYGVLMLISTYRLDGKKAPHWVAVTHIDDRCIYVHDPDLDAEVQMPIDCQHVPIARGDFGKMSAFGATRLRTAIAIKKG
jgi:predicted double-glycine peptidase